MAFDTVIVGAGFAGSVIAERLATLANQRVLVVEKRNHVGGNCHDYYNEHGVLVHKYGPHYFRTNSKEVFDYLSRFTEWHYVQYRIRAMVEGRLVPLPINLDTVNELYGYSFSVEGLKEYFDAHKVAIDTIKTSEDAVLAKVGRDLYEKLYRGYTMKQWGVDPRELDASVCERIPIRLNRDDRYFSDIYQAMPKRGYHVLFRNLLDHPNIHVLLQTDYSEIKDIIPHRRLVYTGPIDEFLGYEFGRLPYRSLRFEHETFDREYVQSVSQVNYPNEYDFTRIVEIKHATGQRHPMTTIVREFPTQEGDPYYPVPSPTNARLYAQYREKADAMENVHCIGRLAQYRYMNMDEVIAAALRLAETIIGSQSSK